MARLAVALCVIAVLAAPVAQARRHVGGPVALMTAETENQLVAVDPISGHILKRLTMPADPEYVGVSGDNVVCVSGRAGAVTLLSWPSLRVLATLRGFGRPHLVAFAPDGRWAYVTDDQRGQLDVISLTKRRTVARLDVGALAHHLAVSPDGRTLWVALGETAHVIVTVDTSRPSRPRVSGRFDPGFTVHDLEFTPSGRDVWATGATTPQVGVFDARTHQLLRRIPAAAAPQHVVFTKTVAYVASGYGSSIERVNISNGRILGTARIPYGSFEPDAGDGLVVTSSLLRGTLAVLTPGLRLLRVIDVAPASRDVALAES